MKPTPSKYAESPTSRALITLLLYFGPQHSSRLTSYLSSRGELPAKRWKRTRFSRPHAVVLTDPPVNSITHQVGNLKIQLCGKSPSYTPVFEDNPIAATASVNAGDQDLYVGGGAINAAFAKILGLDYHENSYEFVHEKMWENVRHAPGVVKSCMSSSGGGDTLEAASKLGLLGCFARAPHINMTDKDTTGAAFLDVFRSGSRPLSDRNVAMLYVVGPKGQFIEDQADFLRLVEKTSENALELVSEYNIIAGSGDDQITLPVIEILQFCLVSGGVFKHDGSSRKDVAAAIVRGLVAAAASSQAETLPMVRFAHADGAFEDAVKQHLLEF